MNHIINKTEIKKDKNGNEYLTMQILAATGRETLCTVNCFTAARIKQYGELKVGDVLPGYAGRIQRVEVEPYQAYGKEQTLATIFVFSDETVAEAALNSRVKLKQKAVVAAPAATELETA